MTRTRKQRRGAAAVEFAVIAPFMIALAVGMMEVTRAVQVKNYLSDASRAACRLAAVPGSTTTSVQANAKQVLTNYGIDPSAATITIKVNDKAADPSTAVQNDKVSVQVSVPLSKVGWVSPYFISNTSIASETLSMLRQG